ncbi:neurofilament triplet m protein-like protein [Anaeramoeba flamelloides]|uniref:Neurofilament triplet m protein-like protein n=1 Tax=Anaeramoeba flamelloides TaxID=1746091 RepID=A0AAV7Z4B4_9EUKA|nr:neurofilament triplet m protein-like protein [Anaeramoeba flamelloides]
MAEQVEQFFQRIQTENGYNSQTLSEFKKLYEKNGKEARNALKHLLISITILLSQDTKLLKSKSISSLLTFFQEISREDWTQSHSLKILFSKTLQSQINDKEIHPQERAASLTLFTMFYRRRSIQLAKKLLQSDPCVEMRVKSQELLFDHIGVLEQMYLTESKKEEEKNQKRKRTERETPNLQEPDQEKDEDGDEENQKEKEKDQDQGKKNGKGKGKKRNKKDKKKKSKKKKTPKKKQTLEIETEDIEIPILVEEGGLIQMEAREDDIEDQKKKKENSKKKKKNKKKSKNKNKKTKTKTKTKKNKSKKKKKKKETGKEQKDSNTKEDSEMEIEKQKSNEQDLENNSNEDDSDLSTVLFDNIRMERTQFLKKVLLSRKNLINYLTQNLNLDPSALVRREIIEKFQKYLKTRSKKKHYEKFFASACEEFAPTLLLKTRDKDKRIRICSFQILKRLLRKKKKIFYQLYSMKELCPVLIFAFSSKNKEIMHIAELILIKFLKPQKAQTNIPLGFHVCQILTQLDFVDNYEPFREILKKHVKKYFKASSSEVIDENDESLIPEEM